MKLDHEPWRPGKPVLTPSEMSTISREALKQTGQPLPDFVTYAGWIKQAIHDSDSYIMRMRGDL